MKLLQKRDCDEILKRIAACHIIANEYISDIEAFKKITENLSDITLSVGGRKGADKVQNTYRKYSKSR